MARDFSPSQTNGDAASPRLTGRMQLALAALSGALYVLAFPGVDQFYLAFLAFVPVALAARHATVRRAVLLGAVAGFVSHLGGYYWVVHLLREFAHLPVPVAVIGWLLICVVQGASFGVGLGLSRWLGMRTGWPMALTLAAGLAAMDFLYPLLFPSFVANTMAGSLWMMQTADLWGLLGLTALLGAINGAIADLAAARLDRRPVRWRPAAVVAAVWAGALIYGVVQVARFDARTREAPSLTVGLVQSNVGGQLHHQDRGRSNRTHRALTRELAGAGAELVVWPEGAWNGVVHPERTDVRQEILEGLAQPLLFGGTRVERHPSGPLLPYNSAFLADETGRILGSYDKTVLLAFGEYIPGGDLFPKIYEWLPYSARFGRGDTTAPLPFRQWKIGTYICYEDIIPRFVQKIMRPTDGVRPHLMVNLTNDSWYGDTTEPPIHLALARFRSVEHRRALVRATNTGISAFVDATGRVTSQTATYAKETLVDTVALLEGDTVYQHVGDAAGFLAVGLLAFGGYAGRRRRVAKEGAGPSNSRANSR